MKRDWELIRRILLRVEAEPGSDDVSSFDSVFAGEHEHGVVLYHFLLLEHAGYVLLRKDNPDDEDSPLRLRDVGDGKFVTYAKIAGLTWEGHELLDAIRDEFRWSQIKDSPFGGPVTVTMNVIREYYGAQKVLI